MHLTEDVQGVGDHAANMIRREFETMPLARDERDGGLMLGETGTRNVTISSGVLWDRLNRYSLAAIDTSISGGFDTYFDSNLSALNVTQWPNTSYNNGGVLTTMTNNRFANLWFFEETDGGIVMVYGTAQYNGSAAAQAEGPPSIIPNRLVSDGKLIGRIVFQKGAATATSIDSAFNATFAATQATNHANL